MNSRPIVTPCTISSASSRLGTRAGSGSCRCVSAAQCAVCAGRNGRGGDRSRDRACGGLGWRSVPGGAGLPTSRGVRSDAARLRDCELGAGAAALLPNSGGSGIPQAIAARQLQGRAARERLVSLRLAAGEDHVVLLLGLLCGASIGREGPTVQVGASIVFRRGTALPAAAARTDPRRSERGCCGRLQHAARRDRVRKSRDQPVVRGSHQRDHYRRRHCGWNNLARTSGRLCISGTTHATLTGAQGWVALPLFGILGGLSEAGWPGR